MSTKQNENGVGSTSTYRTASPGAKAGILYGDTLLRLGPDTIKDLRDLTQYLREDHVGEKVVVKVLRSGNVLDLTLEIGARP